MPAETPVVLLDPRQRKKYYFEATPLRRVLTPLAKLAFRLFATSHASGMERLPRRGPVVLAVNHVTNFDVFFVQFSLPRPIFYMGKAELYRNPLLDGLLRQLGSFPIERGTGDPWAMNHAARVLAHGQVLGIFPEGRRSHGHGLHPAKTGAARLALAAGCPIVPLAIEGTQHVFKNLPRRAAIRMQMGEPILPRPHEAPLALTDRVMFALAELLPPEQRGAYAQRPQGF